MGTLDSESRLDERLEALLDSYPIRPVVEYMSRRLGLGPGTWTLTVEFREWVPRKCWTRHGPFGAVELETLASRPAPLLADQPETAEPS